jgi:uncharacterized beta-barrel protein YwiB (DUF1934 family)
VIRYTEELSRCRLNTTLKIKEEKTVLKLSSELPILETLLENYD